MTTAKQERRPSLREHLANFGDDLTEDDKQKLFFLYSDHIPRGTQELLKTAVQIFQHLHDRAVLNFDEPDTVIDMMLGLKKERWALETMKFFGSSFGCKSKASCHGGCDCNHQLPEQESRESLPVPPPTTSTPAVVRREPQSPDTGLSNSLKRRLHLNQHLPEFNKLLAQNQTSSNVSANRIPIRTSGTNTQYNTSPHGLPGSSILNRNTSSCSSETVSDGRDIVPFSIDTDVRMRLGSQTATHPPPGSIHTRLTRNPSNASKSSKYSSGYYSGVPEEIDGEDEDDEEESEQEYIMRHQDKFYSPQDSSCSTSRCSTLGSMPRSPSAEGYLTADDGDQESNGHTLHELGHGLPSPSSNAGHHHFFPRQTSQKLEGEMAVQVKDLQKAVEKSRIKSFGGMVHKSCPFPYFNSDKGVTFQIHLYPISLRNPSSCAVYLVVLGWSPDTSAIPLPKFEINVSVVQSATTATRPQTIGSQVEEIVVKSKNITVDVMNDPLPLTPSDVNYTNIALFPSLLSHTELDQLDSKNIFIKASLSFCASIPS